MSTAPTCSRCGTALGRAAPGTLCARCMLAAGLSEPDRIGDEDDLPDANGAGSPGVSVLGRFGSFELLEEIGRGGMGVVYRARDLRLRRVVALKMILAGQFASPQEVKRFRSEAEAVAKLDHPNIVPIYEVGEHDGHPYFSMKLMEGGSLAEVMGQWQSEDGAYQAARVVATLARAVHHAHQRTILHCDLKPANVLLDGQGVPHVADFGLAKCLDDAGGVTLSGTFLGSPSFMAPEQAAGLADRVTTAVDTYSLGAVLYQMLTGRPPFQGQTPLATMEQVVGRDPSPPRQLQPGVPVDLETICLKCLEKDPHLRYASADALADDLERCLRNELIQARPASTRERLAKWVRRKPAVAVLVFLLGMALLGGTIGMSAFSMRLAAANRDKDQTNARMEREIRNLEWQKVEDLVAANQRSDALAYLSHFLRENANDQVAAARAVSMLSAVNFALPVAPLMEHGAAVNHLDLSPDGRLLATVTSDQSIRIWEVPGGTLQATLTHAQHVTQGVFTSEADLILITTQDAITRLWDWRSGRVVHSFAPAADAAFGALLSEDRRFMTLFATETSMQVWSLPDCQPVGAPMTLPNRLRWGAFSPDGHRFLLASEDGNVGVWEVSSETRLGPELRMPGDVTRVGWSPDGTRWVIAWESHVSLCDARDGRILQEFKADGQVLQLSFSPDGRRLYAMAYGQPVKIWDVATGDMLGQPIEAEKPFAFFALTPDGDRLATRSGTGVARIWDALTGLPLSEPIEHEGSVTDLAFLPDGLHLVTTSQDGAAYLWQMQQPPPAGPRWPTVDSQPAACFSLDGRKVYRVSHHAVQAFNVHSGRPVGQPMPHTDTIGRLVLSPDGRRLATAGWDNMGRIWDAETGKPVTPQLRHKWRLFDIAFSPDGRLVATAGAESLVRFWDAVTGQQVGPELRQEQEIASVRFSPDSKALLTAGRETVAFLWSVETGKPLWPEPIRHKGAVSTAEFSPDGRRIVTASTDRSARVWDRATGRPLTRPILHGRGVLSAGFSPDGRWLLTCSEDGVARVWNARTGEPVSVPMLHKARLTHGVFSPDGRLVLTGARDGMVRLWDAQSGYPLNEAVRHGGRITGLQFRSDGRQCLSVARGDALRVWDVPEAPVPVPMWFPALVEAVAGKRLNEHGEVEIADRQEIKSMRDMLRAASTQDFYVTWTKWFLEARVHPGGGAFLVGEAAP